VLPTQDVDDRVRRLLVHRAQLRELQARLVARSSEAWSAKTVLIVHQQLDPPALSVGQADVKLVFRDIRCVQAAVDL
jgi:hypothetical protein